MDLYVIGVLLVFLSSPLILSSPLGQFDLVIWFCGFTAGISLLTMIGVAKKFYG